ncbi:MULTISPECIES: alcohol dehydrogenase catalytic domain-containing protein [Streptomyces]|uniref:alcohol dehydrogenase catalytic domain-containing protein n=1 Tax=Streptomyces TaxID=1883 RepID=UPI00167BA63B|nr:MULTISPECIES: zinc-binding dehydrogenase [unclassified Streptomyces]MCI4144478.1 zinc-binding dehydrogenase [Streptomyces sp. MMS20-AI2-20]GGQ31127.1 zinc-binding dehydrogenase [Streptomyces gancidicus]
MRSVVHTRPGDPAEVLELREEDGRPRPGAGEVLVRLRVRPVHPGDLIAVEGGLPGLPDQDSQPRTPGVEGMGVVEEAGADVRAPLVGRRVAAFPAPGTWAEYVVVPAERAVPVPDEVGDDTAALMLVNPLTLVMLHRAVEQALDGHDGPVVQTAAGSSVGRLVSAHAERHGLPLVNLVRGAAGARKVREMFPGQPVIVTSDADWQDQVRRATGGGGARAVLDCVGGSLTRDLVGLLGDGGTLISYGRLGSGVTMLDELPLVNRGLTVRGVTIWHWTDRTPEQRAEDLAFAVDLARTSPELLEVAARYDLADVTAAVKHARRPGKSGTVLLTSPEETGGAR